ncbi:response regulator transcription factor [Nocardia sp. AG03]|uniref:response regulator transcription factor n=1 Tax=Nocardia sp. AG03 TaxID=3025312 RepID=UPI002418189F|nr:response regulator transcription factor [Nocardia sp. AG03]
MITIAVVDDHPLVRDGIRGWCAAADPPIEVVAEFAEPQEFHDAGAVEADVVVLDLQFRGRAADLTTVEQLSSDGHRVVVYSHRDEPDIVLDCLDLGAISYLSKEEGRDRLIDALRSAVEDRSYPSPTMAKAMHSGRTAIRPKLSAREREVLLYWFQTESKAMVAQQLYLSVGTVDTYLARIRTKYAAVGRSAPTKAALVARAIKDGLITADEL